MIDLAMSVVCADLNAFFRRRKGDTRDRVVVSGFSDPQSGSSAEAEDGIFFLLTRIAEETNVGPMPSAGGPPGLIPRVRAPIHLNLDVMFASMYRHFETGLQVLSEIIAYLQAKPNYTHANTPGMNAALGTMAFKMISLDYAQQSYLWGSLGAKYVPSVVYSLRLITVGQEQIGALEPAVTERSVNGQPGLIA